MRKLLKENGILLCILFFSTVVLLGLITQKEGMSLDEYLSYGLANNDNAQGGMNLWVEQGKKLNPVEVFDVFFYADSFDVQSVWKNQRDDVHPPFFYLIIHIFCLLTGNYYGLKTGVLLNVLLHICNICLLYALLQDLIGRKFVALLGAAWYGFHPVVLGTVLFIRMYVMLSMFVFLLTLFFVRRYKEQEMCVRGGVSPI